MEWSKQWNKSFCYAYLVYNMQLQLPLFLLEVDAEAYDVPWWETMISFSQATFPKEVNLYILCTYTLMNKLTRFSSFEFPNQNTLGKSPRRHLRKRRLPQWGDLKIYSMLLLSQADSQIWISTMIANLHTMFSEELLTFSIISQRLMKISIPNFIINEIFRYWN